MILKIRKNVLEHLGGGKKLVPYGMSDDGWTHRDIRNLDLGALKVEQITKLRTLFESAGKVHGIGILVRDIDTWLGALKNSAGAKGRTVLQFSRLLERFLLKVPGHRVYERQDDGVMLAHYVNRVAYIAEERRHGDLTPAHVRISLVWEIFSGRKGGSETFWADDCVGVTVTEALARRGYYQETPELRAVYLAERARFHQVVPQIGKQFWARGWATDDMDGNPGGRDDSWYWSRTKTIPLEVEGESSRVVIDVFYETPKNDRESKEYVDTWFWPGVAKHGQRDEDDDEPIEDDYTEEARPEIEVPIHPYTAVFHLAKHLRLRLHVNHLTEYTYDTRLADKLVLPEQLKTLVIMLLQHKEGTFKDVVRGKGGGAVVLLSGPPGTGKTLTAEVYAESEQRALYSIQCSQLGTDPDELENELLKCFARSRRWNAIMLLDEADVYVHERGNSLAQNAIVGVFLRVLEYQSSVLFLTTNRPDEVDDAIASRCIARLRYLVPPPEMQVRIWEVLAQVTGANLSSPDIQTIVARNPNLSGRDVKNLLKLALLVKGQEPITPDTVDFVKQFKPTGPMRQSYVLPKKEGT